MTRTILAAIIAMAATTGVGHAQSWPSKQVRVIVPVSAGSAIDIVARATSQRLSRALGQTFVI